MLILLLKDHTTAELVLLDGPVEYQIPANALLYCIKMTTYSMDQAVQGKPSLIETSTQLALFTVLLKSHCYNNNNESIGSPIINYSGSVMPTSHHHEPAIPEYTRGGQVN